MNSAQMAWDVLQRMSQSLQRQHPELSPSEAIVKAAESPQGAEWYTRLREALRRGERVEYRPEALVRKQADPSPRAEVWGEIQQVAARLRKADPTLSPSAAVAAAVTRDPDLYAHYRQAARA